MCGIVGYVGARPALGIVLDGLRRLEYRGYDSAGVAVIADGELLHRASGPASSPTWRRRSPSRATAAGPGRHRHRTDRHRAHPLGHPRRPDRPQRAPAPLGRRPGRGHPQRHHRELRQAARRARGRRRRVRQRHRHRVRRAPARGRVALPPRRVTATPATLRRRRREVLAEAMRRSAAGWRARSPCSPSTRDAPGVVVGARRNSPLVVGRGDGENFLASDVSAFIEHTREAVELGQDQVVADHRRRHRDHRLRRQARRRARTSTSTGTRRAAEKGGYDYFMLKEIAEQPQAVADTLLGRLTDSGEIVLDEVRLTDQDLRDVDKIFIVACGTAYHAGHGRQVRHRALDPHPVRGRAGQRVPLPRPGARPVHAGRGDLASPARRWTP